MKMVKRREFTEDEIHFMKMYNQFAQGVHGKCCSCDHVLHKYHMCAPFFADLIKTKNGRFIRHSLCFNGEKLSKEYREYSNINWNKVINAK